MAVALPAMDITYPLVQVDGPLPTIFSATEVLLCTFTIFKVFSLIEKCVCLIPAESEIFVYYIVFANVLQGYILW